MSVAQRRGLIEPGAWSAVDRAAMRVGVDQPVIVLLPADGREGGDLALMRLIDAQFLETPWYGSRQMSRHLRRDGHEVGRKRVR